MMVEKTVLLLKAVPTMPGAGGIRLVKFLFRAGGITGLELLLIGSLISFAVSLLVIRGLMDYVRRHSFSAFGVYRICLGLAVLYFAARKGVL